MPRSRSKTKAWRKPEFKIENGWKILIKQQPFQRRRMKSDNRGGAWLSGLMYRIFDNVGLINHKEAQV